MSRGSGRGARTCRAGRGTCSSGRVWCGRRRRSWRGRAAARPSAGSVRRWRAGGVWTESAKLVRASDRQAQDLFGSAVAIADDAVLVGAYGRVGSTGAAYVFERAADVWSQTQELTAPAPTMGELYGFRSEE